MDSVDKADYINLTDYASQPVEQWQNFVGYDYEDYITEVVKIRPAGEFFEAALKETPFYAEAGGQVGDTGILRLGDMEFPVADSTYDEAQQRVLIVNGDYTAFKFAVQKDNSVRVEVDHSRRLGIRRNHTGTHLLHHALRKILGDHVQQAGSFVHPDYLRFDYTHYQKPSSEELFRAEKMAAEIIMTNLPVTAKITSIEDARSQGAMALFGEKYGEEVRMISVGDVSRELCGGTHCDRSGDVGFLRITSETGVSAGVRRIEAVTGDIALELVTKERKDFEYIREILHSHGSDAVEKLQKFVDEKKSLEKEIEKLRKSGGGIDLRGLLDKAKEINGSKIISTVIEAKSLDEMKDFGDVIRNTLKSGVGFLAADLEGKAGLVCVVTDDLIGKGIKAGDMIKSAAKAIGGGGGGRPHLATAGAKSSENLEQALTAGVESAVQNLEKLET